MYLYTKEWYQALQTEDWLNEISSVPDQEYSDEDIHFLFQQRFQQYIQENPNVDSGILCKEFEENYQMTIALGYKIFNYPRDIIDNVDIRLIALNYMPESVYEKLKTIQEGNKQVRDSLIEQNMTRYMKNYQSLRQTPRKCCSIHDIKIKQIVSTDHKIVVIFDDSYFDKLVLKNAEVIENELLNNTDRFEALYWEIYTDIPMVTYEVHLLAGSIDISSGTDLRYLTVRAQSMELTVKE